jgi:hypothetical protein
VEASAKLAACRPASLSALETYYAGVRVGTQTLAACGLPRASLTASSSLVRKNRYLARNSKLGDEGVATSLGNCYRCVCVGLRRAPDDGRQPTKGTKTK